ncbi:MAG TPA: hypothetical protein VHA06_15760 [Candidatus Angelobacter sp.]|nr:hypothetical protein [Candidatus Angelobacter sp.]
MNKPPNPITQGLRAVSRDPLIFMLEILWRWVFGLLACLLVFATGAMLLGPLPIMKRWPDVWNSHDPQMMGAFFVGIVFRLGNMLIIAAVAVSVVIALVWAILSGLGRSIIVRRLRKGVTSLRFRSVMALQFLRGYLTLICVMSLIAAVVVEIKIATNGSKPDLVMFYIMAMPSILLIGGFWLITNWYLTLASIFGRDGQSFAGAFRQARQTVAKQFSDFAGTGFVFLLLRLVLLLVALTICGLSSRSVGSQQTYFTLVMVVTAVYFAVSDYLHMARMASYLALAAAHVEPGGPKLVVSSTSQTAENSTAH